MKNITTGKYTPTRYLHKGIRIERSCLSWIVWADFVTEHWAQPRTDTLAQAQATVNAIITERAA